MAHLFIVVVYDSFNRNNVKISKTYNFPDFSFFMSQDDAHYHNHQNAPVDTINRPLFEKFAFERHNVHNVPEHMWLRTSCSRSTAAARATT